MDYYTYNVDKFQKHVAKWHLSQTTTYCMSLLIWNSIKDKSYSNRKQISGCPHQGGTADCQGAWGNFLSYENVLYLDCSGGYTTDCTYLSLNCTPKIDEFCI